MAGFRYFLKTGTTGPKAFYRCSKWYAGCRASVVLLEDDIISIKNEHSLEGPPSFTQSRRGCLLMVTRGHRFNITTEARGVSGKRRWWCSKWYAGCRVSITTLHDQIVKVINIHYHF
ncbi:FLYWCH zinc finger domain-containing protein [Phthorimaea operculella]|nr:FLYWCH zinc finger domain-containing protein [Phthorimaea operculella]